MTITILGAGSWGTALALVLQQNSHSVTLWGHDPVNLAEMASERENKRYLPGIPLPQDLKIESDLGHAVDGASGIILAVPSKAFREISKELADYSGLIVSATKGIEHQTGKTMCGILGDTVPRARAVALSGPSLAAETALGIPTAVVAASRDSDAAKAVQCWFHRPTFRVYTSPDVLGVELAGALKNVIAIAAGVCDGLGYGENSKAALMTRGKAEMQRLGVSCGARAETFSGLSGIGDLAVTCFSKLSRNRGFGERIGRGESIANILSTTRSAVEGYPTARSAHQLGEKMGVPCPIIHEVYSALYLGKDPRKAVIDLLGRDSKPED